MLPRETFAELTFYITDADSMEEDNVLVRHLPHHACRFKECLLERERGWSLNCCHRGKSSKCLTNTEHQVTETFAEDRYVF